jgi:hypothetical protein
MVVKEVRVSADATVIRHSIPLPACGWRTPARSSGRRRWPRAPPAPLTAPPTRLPSRARLVLQAGLGGVWADIEDDDSGVADTYSSFLIPIGIGVNYAATPRIAVLS